VSVFSLAKVHSELACLLFGVKKGMPDSSLVIMSYNVSPSSLYLVRSNEHTSFHSY